jgi:hypothetical protein
LDISKMLNSITSCFILYFSFYFFKLFGFYLMNF